ncbi:hypothetical protein BV582_21480 [Bacillus paralicheniformis]|uniref:hypothetical protein n=1 Tax=Bacillus paralicheniformis TaxID=1648923 RepID=UPI000C77EE7A|nr:hypothetical protein [Bacillus paralicheniformis]PLC14144.1 hypothetical protein BV582_21480 [Bacillus paralicheniformis]
MASKEYYRSIGYRVLNTQKTIAACSVGQQFSIYKGLPKVNIGTWEIENRHKNSDLYWCRRVLNNGKLSRSEADHSFRIFSADQIEHALKEEGDGSHERE